MHPQAESMNESLASVGLRGHPDFCLILTVVAGAHKPFCSQLQVGSGFSDIEPAGLPKLCRNDQNVCTKS